jgi:hypothetical protein
MTLLCTMMGHTAAATHHRNDGVEFALCHHCACDLIRLDGGDWSEVPAGFKVVWRETSAPAAMKVSDRLTRQAPPRRRDPRSARPAPRRDPRGRPFGGMGSIMGALTHLGDLVSRDEDVEAIAARKKKDSVIRLPSPRLH